MKYYTTKNKKFRRGELLFSEHSDCDGMYIVNSGRVRVFKTVGPEKKEVDLCVLGPRAMFGEMAIIDNSPRSASVQALEPTDCTIITRAVFEEQLSRVPDWMVNLIRILVKRLRETNERLRETVEQYTVIPDDDPGSMFVIDPEGSTFVGEEFGTSMSDRAQAGMNDFT